MCTDLSSGVGVASQQPDCCFTPPLHSCSIERPEYSLYEGVMYNWRAGLKLITLLTPGTRWQLEMDLSARDWFANELPPCPAPPSPPFPPPCRPPPFSFFFFKVYSVPESSFYIVPWQMLCRAAIVPRQFFWDREESQKISTCDFFFSLTPGSLL